MNSTFEFECFMAAAETLNFTTAAQRIHITQPALSRNIASLEEGLGFLLFQRSKKTGIRITPAGLALYNGLKDLGAQYQQLLEHVRQINRGEEGKLVLSVLSGIDLSGTTVPLIRAFRERYPQVEVILKSCKYEKLLESVNSGAADACFSLEGSVAAWPDLLWEPIGKVESRLAVPARLDCQPDKTYRLTDFQNETFLLSEDAPDINEMFVSVCRRAGFEPHTQMAPDFETKMLWVEMGIGVAAHCAEHYMVHSSLVDFVRVEELLDLENTFVWHRENYNPAIALFYPLFN